MSTKPHSKNTKNAKTKEASVPTRLNKGDSDLASQFDVQDPSVTTLFQNKVGASGSSSIESQVALFQDPRLSLLQRQALAREIGSIQGNKRLGKVLRKVKYQSSHPIRRQSSSAVIQRSALSHELETIWITQGKGPFFERLRHLDQSDQDLMDFINSTLRGDDLWLARNIMLHGPESNWPIHLQVERELKGWSGRIDSSRVLTLLNTANATEFDTAIAAMTQAQTRGFLANISARDRTQHAALIDRITSARMMHSAQGLVGQTATWVPSSPGSGNTFETWASAATEGAAPPVRAVTTINCWEMVLLAAYRAGIVTWQWIHDLYINNRGPGWFDHLVRTLSGGSQTTYDVNDPNRPRPRAGQIVFWDGASHVGLAMGTQDGLGRSRVFSFWPPPNTAFTAGGTVDQVKITTIEELAAFMTAHPQLGTPTVTFGGPPW